MDDVLTGEQGKSLLQLARQVIGERLGVEGGVASDEAELRDEYATFVTLKIGGVLRGCIGNLQAEGPVMESVRKNAVSAAFHDSRFSPLTAEELQKVHIDISVLSPPKRLEYKDGDDLTAKLRPGIDGVILRLGSAGATFLPQVWEQLPVPELFLGHLCRKAGLSDNAWRVSHPQIEIYQVQSFAEEEA